MLILYTQFRIFQIKLHFLVHNFIYFSAFYSSYSTCRDRQNQMQRYSIELVEHRDGQIDPYAIEQGFGESFWPKPVES